MTTRVWAVIAGGLVVAALVLGSVTLGMGGAMRPGMMGSGFGGGGWGLAMGLGWLSMIVSWAAVIVGVILLLRLLASQWLRTPSRGEAPLDILQRRYARGEITRDQYEQMRHDVMS